MDTVALIEHARQVGLTIWAEGDALQVEGHPTPDALAMIETLRHDKVQILAHLRQEADAGHQPWVLQALRQCDVALAPFAELLHHINAWAGSDPARWKRIRSEFLKRYSPNPRFIDGRDIVVAWASGHVALGEASAGLQTLEGIHGMLRTRDFVAKGARQADVGFWGRLVTRLEAQLPSVLVQDREMTTRLRKMVEEQRVRQ